MQTFTAKTNFKAKINNREIKYLEGYNYNIRPGNTELEKAVTQWVRDGLVYLGAPVTTSVQSALGAKAGKITGSMTVQPEKKGKRK